MIKHLEESHDNVFNASETSDNVEVETKAVKHLKDPKQTIVVPFELGNKKAGIVVRNHGDSKSKLEDHVKNQVCSQLKIDETKEETCPPGEGQKSNCIMIIRRGSVPVAKRER